jgi:AraC family transcriptional regulator
MATHFRHLLPALNRLADSVTPVNLDQVGHDACLSPGRAQRVFAEQIGESPKQYQLRVRLQRAAALLLGTEARIVDIAIASGFNSHEAFTRAFTARFGVNPSGYRSRLASRPDARAVRVAAATAPCIGLYRRPLDNNRSHQHQPQENRSHMETPEVEITRRDVEETPVLYGTRKLEKDKVGDGLAEVLPAAFGYAMAHGLAMAGPPIVRYLDFGPATLTVEAGVPLAEPADAPPEDSGLSTGVIPGGSVATAVHKGPYETLGQTYLAIERWVEAEGLSAGGPPWEVYLTDPAEVPDPADWLTEINWPVA